MNDLANIVAKLLPIGLIAGLFAIFYLLDVFSVRPNSDAASTTRASVAQPAPASGQPASSQPATSRIELPPGEAVSSVPRLAAPSGIAVPPADAQTESEMGINDPPLPRQVALPPDQIAPQYVPPGGSAGQPLATDLNNGRGPVLLPSHEMSQDEAERIEAETQREMNELDSAAAAGGQVERTE